MSYSFHLTTTVQPDGHQQFREFKLESEQMNAQHPGLVWAVLVRGAGADSDCYFLLAQWDSEKSLDEAGARPEKAAAIARHQPYRHMLRVPALREVVEVLVDERAPGTDPDALEAVHRRLGPEGSPLAGEPHRRLLARAAGDSDVRYEITLWRAGTVPEGVPKAELLLIQP